MLFRIDVCQHDNVAVSFGEAAVGTVVESEECDRFVMSHRFFCLIGEIVIDGNVVHVQLILFNF